MMAPHKTLPGIIVLTGLFIAWLGISLLFGFQWMSLTPLVLLVSSFVIGFYHPTPHLRFAVYAGIVFMAGFGLSAIGTNTGTIFGLFFFGQNLGFMIANTPLLMGIIWLLFSYTTAVTASRFLVRIPLLNKSIFKIILASIMMLTLDVLLEQVASRIDFWYWKNQQVPFQNYSSWFVIAFVFNFLFQRLKLDSSNKLTDWFLLLLGIFLVILNGLPYYYFS
jgi:putative membrane protein